MNGGLCGEQNFRALGLTASKRLSTDKLANTLKPSREHMLIYF